MVLAMGLTTSSQLAWTRVWLEHVPWVHEILFQVLPVIVFTCFLTLFYLWMPNTAVRWQAAAVGAFLAGTLLHVNSLLNVLYVSRVVSYSKIYGSLGILPIFLIGLYFSWLIVLFGAQVAYAYQNRGIYLGEKQAESINQRGREFVAFRLFTYIGQRFQSGLKPPSRVEMSHAVGVPSQLACQVFGPLIRAGLLIEIVGDEIGYAPARPLHLITADDILRALRSGSGQELATRDDEARLVVRQGYEKILKAEVAEAKHLTLQELVDKSGPLTRSN
jgi:membrane protein